MQNIEALFQNVCSTCLATDRALSSLQKTPQLLNICNGLTLSINNMVCYECQARLKHFVKFRSRALCAERFLSFGPRCQLPSTKTFSSSDIKCLSTLTQTVISPYATICLDGDLVEVKQEAFPELEVKTEAVELTAEPLFVQELKVEGNPSTNEEAMTDMGDDDTKSNSSSDDDMPQQIEDPLITKHYTAIHMELSEVLSHMENTRSLKRYKSARYKCDRCAQTFTTEPQYRVHAKRHSVGEGSFKCEVCEQRFKKNGKALKLHTAAHYTRYACHHCPRSCFSYSQMYVHYRNVHDAQTMRFCAKCPASFLSHKELLHHKQRMHRRKYPCPSCDRQYTSSVGLWRHRHVHDDSLPELECNFCHKKYKGEFYLKNHIRDVHEMKPGAYCVECNLQFKNPSQYKQHLKRTTKHIPIEDSKYECDYCHKRFAQKHNLTLHIEVTHLKLSNYKCDVCEERFHTKRNVDNHKRQKHSNTPKNKKQVCHICAKVFALRKSLTEHMNIHLGVRPYRCKLCEATFAYDSALYHHNQLVHLKKSRKSKGT